MTRGGDDRSDQFVMESRSCLVLQLQEAAFHDRDGPRLLLNAGAALAAAATERPEWVAVRGP